MHSTPPVALLSLLAIASPALGALTNVFATNLISVESSIANGAESDNGPEFADLFILDQIGSMNESWQSASMISNGSALATADSVATFSTTTDELNLTLNSRSTASLNAGANDTFSFVKSRVANIMRFTTDEPVRVTLTGDAAIAFDLNNILGLLVPQTTIEIIREFGPDKPVFQELDLDGEFAFEVILGPGAYLFRASSDTTFQTFGFPQNLYTADSELNLAVLIAPVPAPAAALLFPLAAGFAARRRR